MLRNALLRKVCSLVLVVLAPLVTVCVAAQTLHAQTVFYDNFEGDLSQWVGKSLGAHHGVIVYDPHDPSNSVLTFTGLAGAGDVYSTEITVLPGEIYELWFDYLGLALPGSTPGNYGGFIGVSDQTPGYLESLATAEMLGGTITDVGTVVPWTVPSIELIDDGTWHSYTIPFDPYQLNDFVPTNSTIRVMAEDWNGGGLVPVGVPGDAFFDNIQLVRMAPVPTRTTTWGKIKALYNGRYQY